MEIEIIEHTPDPLNFISRCAGTSYGKDDDNIKRAQRCFDNGHMSVFEHASITFKISGISRACSHQLVRHRLASYTQKSQRYTKIDVESPYFVFPCYITGKNKKKFLEVMEGCGKAYKELIEAGVKPEDARYVLPEATKTEMVVTMNLRELFHFLQLRTDRSAQQEIRDMAFLMLDSMGKYRDLKPVADLFWTKLNA